MSGNFTARPSCLMLLFSSSTVEGVADDREGSWKPRGIGWQRKNEEGVIVIRKYLILVLAIHSETLR